MVFYPRQCVRKLGILLHLRKREMWVGKMTLGDGVMGSFYDVSEMMDDLNGNAMKAQSKYKGQYIEIVGRDFWKMLYLKAFFKIFD